jgi:hypothetical protein
MALQETEVDETTGLDDEEEPKGRIIKIPVVKAGKDVYVEMNTKEIPDSVYQAALERGMKDFVNRKMTKIAVAGLEGKDLEAAQAKAYEQALENVEDIKAGKVRGATTKRTGTGKINTEAMRIARQLVKDAMKRDKIRLADVDAKEITAAAKELIEDNPDILEEAKKNLEAREKKEKKIVVKTSKIKLNPTKVAANNAKRKTTKAPVEGGAKVRQRGEARA